MKLTYIFHSGFALETRQSLLVFDYWLDPAGVVPQLLTSEKRMYVFASHFHEDHFTREIFKWRDGRKDIRLILSKDILRHRRAQRDEADVWMAKGSTWQDGTVSVAATGSTDSGVSWTVTTEGLSIFHAGDLNNWYARFLADSSSGRLISGPEPGIGVDAQKEERRYLGELKDIRKITDHFDVVMFPVDSRIGNGYTRGARQFIRRFRTGLFVPMHFAAGGFESAWRMKEFTDAQGIPFWSIRRNGESREFTP